MRLIIFSNLIKYEKYSQKKIIIKSYIDHYFQKLLKKLRKEIKMKTQIKES